MTVKDLKKVIETLPNDFEVVISADIGGNKPFNFCELEDISVDIGYSSKVVHFFGILQGGRRITKERKPADDSIFRRAF